MQEAIKYIAAFWGIYSQSDEFGYRILVKSWWAGMR